MKDRQHDSDERQRTPGSEDTGAAPPTGEDRQERVRRLLEAGDDAIRRALSRNSDEFLSHNRQQGGQ
ncbi:MAG: hypothetical protein JRH16_18285 [Deltaproteobacteria bacterium]|nr:hypothetical protein [Deltaproteobacteria bacterium]MBW2362727.1 hypothetical protein [Deltaproteobacteria bacterium]